jgi:hypothetical protein
MITTRLVAMANQIALGVPDRAHVADQVVQHLRSFWAPFMINELAAHAAASPGDLQPEVVCALMNLRPKVLNHG